MSFSHSQFIVKQKQLWPLNFPKYAALLFVSSSFFRKISSFDNAMQNPKRMNESRVTHINIVAFYQWKLFYCFVFCTLSTFFFNFSWSCYSPLLFCTWHLAIISKPTKCVLLVLAASTTTAKSVTITMITTQERERRKCNWNVMHAYKWANNNAK